MNRNLIYLVLSLWFLVACEPPPQVVQIPKEVEGDFAIIPAPLRLQRSDGHFRLSRRTDLIVNSDALRGSAEFLRERLRNEKSIELEIVRAPGDNPYIVLTADHTKDPPDESYSLDIDPSKVAIVGSEIGAFYAVQSLLQIIPDIERDGGETVFLIPAGNIVDQPRFSYRGMHLDVARHYMPPAFVKKYIELISRYKFNYLHWHLTDDQGWRVEIKKFPRLTSVGSIRSETVRADAYPTNIGDGRPVSGFYTQEEIRDIVAFAKSRFVTIIPEIDLPGHSAAALAAYPNLGCRKDYSYGVKTTWGGFPDIYCPTEETFSFIKDVFIEVLDMFPASPYIHVGGDEVNLEHWENCDYVAALKKHNKFTSGKQVHGLFIKRVSAMLNAMGKKAITWDETTYTGVKTNGTVMAWRNPAAGIRAVQLGYDVIMVPRDFTYFDRPQSAAFEPRGLGRVLDLQTVYDYDPVPAELPKHLGKRILGGQGAVWTEFVVSPERVEYMAFPRAIALAEVLWSRREVKDYRDFIGRLQSELLWLERQGVNYRIPEPFGLQDQTVGENGETTIALTPPVHNARVYYTLDGTAPDQNSQLYLEPLVLAVEPLQVLLLRTIVVTPDGRQSNIYEAKYTRTPLKGTTEGEIVIQRVRKQ